MEEAPRNKAMVLGSQRKAFLVFKDSRVIMGWDPREGVGT